MIKYAIGKGKVIRRGPNRGDAVYEFVRDDNYGLYDSVREAKIAFMLTVEPSSEYNMIWNFNCLADKNRIGGGSIKILRVKV